jgi:WbqC-like protein family
MLVTADVPVAPFPLSGCAPAKTATDTPSLMATQKSIAILQSNYIPWKGYFDIIAAVDEFLIFDEAQFTRRDWRNRNKIVIDGSPHWLTIPVANKGRFEAPIKDIEVSEPGWAEKHWRSIKHAYGKAQFFPLYAPILEETYHRAAALTRLSDINELFLRKIAGTLELTTIFRHTDQVPRQADKPTGRLVEVCLAREATVYVSGPAARDYIQNAEFEAAGVKLMYADYARYPVYDQRSEAFEHRVSVIDTLMRCGPETRGHLQSIQRPGGLLTEP